MKKILLIMCLLVGIASVSFAQTQELVLTWDDPNPASAMVTGYEVAVDVQTPHVLVVPNTYGLLSLSDGEHTFWVRAVNAQGESVWSEPLVWTKGAPSGVILLRIETRTVP